MSGSHGPLTLQVVSESDSRETPTSDEDPRRRPFREPAVDARASSGFAATSRAAVEEMALTIVRSARLNFMAAEWKPTDMTATARELDERARSGEHIARNETYSNERW